MSKTANSFIYIFAGILLAILVKFFVFDIYKVQGTSMEKKFHSGQFIFVNKFSYGLVNPFQNKILLQWKNPKENDIVLFVHNGTLVVKRCAAVAGDLLEYSTDRDYNLLIKDESGFVKKIIPLTEIQYHSMKGNFFVPEGTILAVGDNYLDSVDSRNYGFVPVANIIGKVICKN